LNTYAGETPIELVISLILASVFIVLAIVYRMRAVNKIEGKKVLTIGDNQIDFGLTRLNEPGDDWNSSI